MAGHWHSIIVNLNVLGWQYAYFVIATAFVVCGKNARGVAGSMEARCAASHARLICATDSGACGQWYFRAIFVAGAFV